MCCGSKRLDAARLAAPAYAQPVARPTQRPIPGGSEAPARRTPAGGAGPVFVHDGPGELIVTGAKTGRRYRFAGRGARLAVDALDAPGLALVDRLRRLP